MKQLKNIFLSWKEGLTKTKITLLVVVIMLIASGIIWAINPQKQFAKLRNSQRRGDVNLIINAVYQYTVDNGGQLPAEIGEQPKEICRKGADCSGLIDLSKVVQKKKNTAYLSSLPVDPGVGKTNGTGYEIKKVKDRVTILAPLAEQGAVISATR